MFTIKYVYPSGQEHISGPYEMVTAELVDESGNHVSNNTPVQVGQRLYQVVHAYKHEPVGQHDQLPVGYGASFTCGPNIPSDPDSPVRFAKVFVMNEHGATVAKYEL